MLRGRKLSLLRGKAIRPTADRLRESIFNIIARWVPNAVVLDLFAGTGAYGIEALSRAARSAVFIDNSRYAISIISRNLKLCRLEARSQVIRWDISAGLNCLNTSNSPFDIVFMDPPYNNNFVGYSLKHLQIHPILAPGSHLVVEHSTLEPIPDDLNNFVVRDQRRYGKSLVSILEYVL
jgi:16S rRNA (guanine966-N2)-methyltransferase